MISKPPLFGAIADDMTGATDLCSTLVREGMRTVQTIGVARGLELPEVDAVVVGLKSRTAPVAEAVRDSRAALDWLRELGARQFFFKYCSTFDSTPGGNIGPVADALLGALDADITVVCPAYPANGRTVYRGHLFVGDTLLSESSMARHPLTPMTDSNLVRFLGRQTSRHVALIPFEVVRGGSDAVKSRLEELQASGVSYAVVDALEDGHLRTIGEACADLPLVTGGAGIALGLPENFRRRGLLARNAAPTELPDIRGPVAVIAGSTSSATQEQVRRMSERYPSLKLDALDGDADALASQAAERLGDGAVLVYSTASPEEVARAQERFGVEAASHAVESGLGHLARRLVDAGARTVVVAGGESSGAVVAALAVRALAVGPELATGVPWMTSLGDPQLTLALKSGNFGGPDFFLEAVKAAR
jgi:3-dehydrotetronate 4-kinase